MFRKNKPDSDPGRGRSAPRGRTPESAPNPLARRFAQDEEPETIDLAGPAGFPDTQGEGTDDGEPETRVASSAPAVSASRTWAGVVGHDAETGKFYALPGTPEAPVLLQGEPIDAPTELRRGDRIRIGTAEFEFLAG